MFLAKKSVFLTFLAIFAGFLLLGADSAAAEDGTKFGSVILNNLVSGLETVVHVMDSILFYPIKGFPVLVLWLIIGGFFFTIYLRFVNLRLFGHAIQVVRGKYSKKSDPGEVSHFQALAAAVSATVGLGNIAGVAIAVSIGGPGAVIWMMFAGLLGMSTKFSEVTLGQKYRKIDKKTGKVSGGAFLYLEQGLKEANLPKLGKLMAGMFAVFCIGSSLGGGNMFQSNQAVKILQGTFPSLNEIDYVIALVLAVSVGIVLIGGIKRIAKVAEKIVPFMAVLYLIAGAVVLTVNSDKLGAAFIFMFEDAFTGVAATGGIIGAIIAGVKRATFSNEAGIGSAPIAHAAAKTKEPVREGCVALLEPFLDTVVICMMTGLVITVTGVYEDKSIEGGVLLTSAAFATVSDWFPIVLSVAIVLFAYSTMITWSYYGERCWEYLFSDKSIGVYHVIFCTFTFMGGVFGEEVMLVVDFSDLLLFAMAVPNLVGLYIMAPKIKKMLQAYEKSLESGKFKKYS